MDINPRVLRYFLALADEQHFRRAAERLHVTSPALSQQIRQLESTLGVQLFERTSRSVRLTEQGAGLVPLARAAVAEADAIAAWAETASRSRRVLRVGFMSTGAGANTQRIVRAAEAELPGVDVQMHYLDWGRQLDELLSGAIDLAFVREPDPPPTLRCTTVLEERRVALLPVSHPLADRAGISFAEIADEVFLPSATGSQAWIDYWLVVPRPDGSEPRLGPSTTTVEEMLELCASHRGISLTAESVPRFYSHPGVRFVPVDDLPLTRVLLCARADSADPAVARFEQVAREHASLAGDGGSPVAEASSATG